MRNAAARVSCLGTVLSALPCVAAAAGGGPSTPLFGIHFVAAVFLVTVTEALWFRRSVQGAFLFGPLLAANLLGLLAVGGAYVVLGSVLSQAALLWRQGDVRAIYWFDLPVLCVSIVLFVALEAQALGWELPGTPRRRFLPTLIYANLLKHGLVLCAFGASVVAHRA